MALCGAARRFRWPDRAIGVGSGGPVRIGDVVAVYTEVVGTGRSSIRIQIEAWVVRGTGSR